jgi:hypothetical protein
MGNGSSQTSKKLVIQGSKPNRCAFVDDSRGRRLMAFEGGVLQAGRSPSPPSPDFFVPIGRESFADMWERLHNDTADGFAVPLADDFRGEVEEYYDSHPTAPFSSVRGFAVTKIYPWVETVVAALNTLVYAKSITFEEYVTEIKYAKTLVAAADRPALYIVFSDEAYARWSDLIQRAALLDSAHSRDGMFEYVRAKLQTLFYSGMLSYFPYQEEVGYVDSMQATMPASGFLSDDVYDRWMPLMTQAEYLESMYASQSAVVASRGYVFGASDV